MQRFGNQIYTLNRKRQVPTLAIYMVITLSKGIYNTMVETFFCPHKVKIIATCESAFCLLLPPMP